MPRVSIGMPVYNGEHYVSEAVESLLAQTFRDFELVIVDNASTDRTPDIARAFAARDARVRYHRNPVNIGGAPNFIRAVELANAAPYFKWAAHYDRHAPEYLEKCVALMDANPDVIVCHSDVEIIDGDGQVVAEPDPELLAAARALDLTDVASDRPSLRFRNLVLSDHMGLDQFGVFRRAELIKTPLIAAYVGSDRVMLAEVGLRGKMRRVPQVLFQNRDFSGRSMRVAPLRARVGWFNPKRAGAIVLPYWRYLFEYLRSIDRVPLSVGERLACWRTLIDWVRQNRWHMQKDVRFAVQRLREQLDGPAAAPRS